MGSPKVLGASQCSACLLDISVGSKHFGLVVNTPRPPGRQGVFAERIGDPHFGFVGRHGLVRIEHAMAAMGAGRTVTYGRVAACVQAGLLRATRQGLRYAGLGELYRSREGFAGLAFLVGDPGFEPGTSSLSETRSNQLS